VQGFVRVGGDGNLIVGCYLYDVGFGTETTRLGFNVAPRDWRRAAHKCADAIYSKLTGELPFFDSRIAYIAETGPKGKRVTRLAIQTVLTTVSLPMASRPRLPRVFRPTINRSSIYPMSTVIRVSMFMTSTPVASA